MDVPKTRLVKKSFLIPDFKIHPRNESDSDWVFESSLHQENCSDRKIQIQNGLSEEAGQERNCRTQSNHNFHWKTIVKMILLKNYQKN